MATPRWKVSCAPALHEFAKLTVPSCSLNWLRPTPGVLIETDTNSATRNARVLIDASNSGDGWSSSRRILACPLPFRRSVGRRPAGRGAEGGDGQASRGYAEACGESARVSPR